MSNETRTVSGLNIHESMDMVGNEVWYKDVFVGLVESQSFDGDKTDVVIRYETHELAEMMKDKCPTITVETTIILEDYEAVFGEDEVQA